MTIEEVRQQLKEWAESRKTHYPECVCYNGIPLWEFTRNELVAIISKTIHELIKKEDNQ